MPNLAKKIDFTDVKNLEEWDDALFYLNFKFFILPGSSPWLALDTAEVSYRNILKTTSVYGQKKVTSDHISRVNKRAHALYLGNNKERPYPDNHLAYVEDINFLEIFMYDLSFTDYRGAKETNGVLYQHYLTTRFLRILCSIKILNQYFKEQIGDFIDLTLLDKLEDDAKSAILDSAKKLSDSF